MSSYAEATARQRIGAIFTDFVEFLPPDEAWTSPHLPNLQAPVAFDDGVIIGRASLAEHKVFVAAQEGGFMGGAVGEVHGAKIASLLYAAISARVSAVLILAESGGVRLHEANAGLIAVSEILRALLAVRAAGIPVLVLIGGANGCFGGMGIVAASANAILMSEIGRLAMSGAEVIASTHGVEEYDARDRALVWRTSGGKHRRLQGECHCLVEDDTAAFRAAALTVLNQQIAPELSLASLFAEQEKLRARVQRCGHLSEPMQVWAALGVAEPEKIALMEVAEFNALVENL